MHKDCYWVCPGTVISYFRAQSQREYFYHKKMKSNLSSEQNPIAKVVDLTTPCEQIEHWLTELGCQSPVERKRATFSSLKIHQSLVEKNVQSHGNMDKDDEESKL